jgi:hypothetical protein
MREELDWRDKIYMRNGPEKTAQAIMKPVHSAVMESFPPDPWLLDSIAVPGLAVQSHDGASFKQKYKLTHHGEMHSKADVAK